MKVFNLTNVLFIWRTIIMQDFKSNNFLSKVNSKKVIVAFPQNRNASVVLRQFNEMQELQGLIARKTQLVGDLTLKLGLAEAGLAILTAKINKLKLDNI